MGFVGCFHFHLLGKDGLAVVVERMKGQQRDVHAAVLGEEPHHAFRSVVRSQPDQEHAQRFQRLQLTKTLAVPLLIVLDLVNVVSMPDLSEMRSARASRSRLSRSDA